MLVNGQTPLRWNELQKNHPFFHGLALTPCAVLMLDYDGTLAPFREDRLQTQFYPGVRARLDRLSSIKDDRLVFISGRNARELRDLMSLSRPVDIWGSHGRELLAANGDYCIAPLTGDEENVLSSVGKALESEYGEEILELKPNSVAVHWRKATSRKDEVEARVRQLYEQIKGNRQFEGVINLLTFDGGLELRAGEGNKGFAVRSILQKLPSDTMASFMGDDITDEDAFEIFEEEQYRSRSCAVLVRDRPRPSCASLWIRPPAELLEFLDMWIQARENRPI